MEDAHEETPKTLVACITFDLQSVLMGLELLETNPILCANCRERVKRIKALVNEAVAILEDPGNVS